MPRLGILGGTFDPPHKGHIAIAEAAYKSLKLQKIIFVPAKIPPHKSSDNVTSKTDRMNMLELAIGSRPDFEISDIEYTRDGPSYTVYTLMEIKRIYPGAEIYFIIGADNIAEIESWYRPEEIFEMATVAAFNRPGFEPSGRYLPMIRILEMDPVEISSTAIREAVLRGKPYVGFVGGPVSEYIAEHKLYGAK